MALATITGTMLAPGVSRNNRLYRKQVIAGTVERLKARLADPEALPVVMRTHHAAGDNTRAIVGRITDVNVNEDGLAKYTASIYDTAAGRDLVAQVGGKDPAFRNVSIFGWWNGDVRQEQYEGQTVETGDDLEVDAIDFTAFPGVPGARIDTVRAETAAPNESALSGRHLVTESISADVIEAEMASKKPGINTPDQKESTVAEQPQIGETSLSDITECLMGPDEVVGFSITAWNGPLTVAVSAHSGMEPGDLPAVAKAAMAAACDALQSMDPDMDGDIDVPGAPGADTDGDMGAGETLPDDDMESAEPAKPVNEARPDPRKVADAIKRRRTEPATETTPAGPAEQSTPEEEPVIDEAAITALIEAALDKRAAQTTPAEPSAGETKKETAVNADTTEAAETAAPDTKTEEQAPARSLTDEDITALAGVLGEAIKGLVPQPAVVPDSNTTETKAEEPKASEPATEAAPAEKFDVKAAMQEAVKEAIPEILDAYGLPRRRGVRTSAETREEMSRDELWDQRADVMLGDYGRPQGQ